MPAGMIAGGMQIAGSYMQGRGAKKAADAQAAAIAAAQENQLAAFNEAQGYISPYMTVGRGALMSIADLYGIGEGGGGAAGAFGDKALDAFRRSPDYDWAMREGNRALTFSNSARGLMNTGHLRSIVDYGQDSANRFFGNYVSRLGSLAEMGRGAATDSAKMLLGNADTMNKMQLQLGDIEGSRAVADANMWTGALKGFGGIMGGMTGGLKMPSSAYSGNLPLQLSNHQFGMGIY